MLILGFPGGTVSKEFACNVGGWVRSLGWEDPLEEGRATHPSILAWRMFHGQRSLVGYSPWGRKELDMTKRLSTAQHLVPGTVLSIINI